MVATLVVGATRPASTSDTDRVRAAVFFGDSWTRGAFATPITDGFAYQTGRTLGVPFDVFGFGSVGYTTKGAGGEGNYAWRLAHQVRPVNAPDPDLVVVQGSVNDAGQDPNEVMSDAEQLIDDLRAAYTNAQIVLLGPAPMIPKYFVTLEEYDIALHAAAVAKSARYISPLAEHWFARGTLARYMTGGASPHPNTAGHSLIARKLTAALLS